MNKLVFFDQAKTKNNGLFEFNIQGLNRGKGYTAYVVSEDSKEPIAISFEAGGYPAYIELNCGNERVTEFNINSFDAQNAMVKFYVDGDAETSTYMVGCAYYDGDKLSKAIIRKDNKIGEVIEFDISEKDIKFDSIKLFLWDTEVGMTPLCKLGRYEIIK